MSAALDHVDPAEIRAAVAGLRDEGVALLSDMVRCPSLLGAEKSAQTRGGGEEPADKRVREVERVEKEESGVNAIGAVRSLDGVGRRPGGQGPSPAPEHHSLGEVDCDRPRVDGCRGRPDPRSCGRSLQTHQQ